MTQYYAEAEIPVCSFLSEAVEEWKRLDVPLLIWGAQNLGHLVADFLIKQGIQFVAFAVNRKYSAEAPKTMDNHPVVVLEDYAAINKCAVLVAFRGWHDDLLDETTKKNITHLYAYDFIGNLILRSDSVYPDRFPETYGDELRELEKTLADELSIWSLRVFLRQRMRGDYSKEYDQGAAYFDREIIQLNDGEIFVDCGSLYGETSLEFIHQMNTKKKTYAHIYAIEPNKTSAEIIKQNSLSWGGGTGDVSILCCGVGEIEEQVRFACNEENSSNSFISEEGTEIIDIRTIDNIVGDKGATFIKMDIEGSELSALKGAKWTITQCRPKLAICVYHKWNDLLTIPQYIQELHSDYRLYLRNYSPAGTELVLYAV